MSAIILELKVPEDISLALQSAGLGQDELRAHAARDLAVQLYSEGRLSFGKAANLAELSVPSFWLLLVQRGLPVFDYTEQDYAEDRALVERWLDRERS
ncbi:MAG: UPF0175 family protein [Chloroflexi bacterium]|nr:UPF0175 family protein [Chloroflexota bacterium]